MAYFAIKKPGFADERSPVFLCILRNNFIPCRWPKGYYAFQGWNALVQDWK